MSFHLNRILPKRGATRAAVVCALLILLAGIGVLVYVQATTVWHAIVVVASVGAVLSGLAGFWTTFRTVNALAPAPSSNETRHPKQALSIMVLPFSNHTGDPAQAYFVDGLTVSFTTDLSRIRDVFVVNVATAFSYRDKVIPLKQLGDELGVRFVLQGSVQRSGTKIRIHTQLGDAISNAQLWSGSFDGDQSDLFSLQDQITERVGSTIGNEMVIVAARESEIRKSDPTVTDLILRARAVRARPMGLANLQQREALLRQALQLDPNNPDAMASLSLALASEAANFGYELGAQDTALKLHEGHDLALKAKQLDPEHPHVYGALALSRKMLGDVEGALRAAEQCRALEPNNVIPYGFAAGIHLQMGEPRKAIDLSEQAMRLDPRQNADMVSVAMGAAHLMLGENAEATKCFQNAIDVNPKFARAYAFLSLALALQGDMEKSREARDAMIRLAPSMTIANLPGNIGAPKQSHPAIYREFWEKKFVPAWRLAGLPE